MSSPSVRAKAVKAEGPPMSSSSRLPAVLSLRVSAASQISASVMPPSPARFSVTGEFTTTLCVKRDAARQLFFAGIHARQHGSGRKNLERAAHREALVPPIDMAQAGRGLQNTNAEPAPALALQAFDFLDQSRIRICGMRGLRHSAERSRYQRCTQSDLKPPPADHLRILSCDAQDRAQEAFP